MQPCDRRVIRVDVGLGGGAGDLGWEPALAEGEARMGDVQRGEADERGGVSPMLSEEEVLAQEGGGEEAPSEGGTDAHRRVAKLLGDLAKTARSFLLYDPRNNAIRQFLASLLGAFESTLAELGALHITVQPFEMYYAGGCVYLNRDRERSLSFRLYRDGVRSLTFQPGFGWEDMAKLLEILSVRYTGVHQNEDDTVTLLWKANFKSLELMAVEGFVPDDDEADQRQQVPQATRRSEGDAESLPDDIDLPAPHLPERATVVWEEVSDEALLALRVEASGATLANDCLQLLRSVRGLLDDPGERLTFQDVSHIFGEVQAFLNSEEHLGSLEAYLDLLSAIHAAEEPAWDAGRRRAVKATRDSCGDVGSIKRLMHSLAIDRRELSPDLVRLLDKACPDPLEVLTQVLSVEYGSTARHIGRLLLEHYGARGVLRLQLRFKGASGHMAVMLLQAIAHVGGEGVAAFIAEQTSHPEPDVQEAALLLLHELPYTGMVGKALSAAYRRADSFMRQKILPVVGATGDARFVEMLERVIEEKGPSMALDEAMDIGRVMGQLAGERGRVRWQGWLTPKGLFRKSLQGPAAQHVAAAAALAEVPHADVPDTLRAALKAADGATQPFVTRCLVRHQTLHRAEAP